MPGLFSRIYLYLSKDYFKNFPDCDIEKLLQDFAVSKQPEETDVKLFDEINVQGTVHRDFYMGRIKKLIIKESNDFISDFENAYSTESLGKYISKRQIKSMVRAFEEKEGKITAYSFVIFHIIFKTIRNDPNCNYNNLKNCIGAVNVVVKDYISDYPNDPIALFLLGCYEVVFNEISNLNSELANKDKFPPIPTRHHCDYDE